MRSYISLYDLSFYYKWSSRMGKPFNQGYVRRSDAAENVTVSAHIVVVHKEFTTVSLVIF